MMLCRLAQCRRFLCYRLLAVLPLLVASAFAAAEESGPRELFDAGYLLQVFGSLLLVFGCLFGLVFLLRKMNGLPASNKAAIRVLGSARLSARERLLLVEAGEQQLLIGVAPGNIRTLHTFEQPIEGLPETGAQSADFASLLGRFAPGKDA